MGRYLTLSKVLPALWLLITSFAVAQAPPLVPVPELGLRAPLGFRVTLYADERLANDMYAMTLDAQGRVVVTGQGYIKVLHDLDNDGVADTATLFATTQTGGMGLCFDGPNLLFSGDGYFSRYVDRDGDGRADGTPERIFPLHFAEHGVHAMRKGPDGWWYLIGGNDTGFSRKNATLSHSPIKEVEAGALLRINPDLTGSEIVAHGFRNPYDFDFNWLGDLFTYDSDVESDFFLPWYMPTRLYHVGYAAHHGWRLTGWKRSWARPDYYADTTDMLLAIGRGSPTGVTCYRHSQFPDRYHGGLFVLDWVFGKVHFVPLRQDGASYRAQAEVFLEPIGTHGFAPNDIAVAPDGSLFISIGGRKTRGAVYHVEYAGPITSDAQLLQLLPIPTTGLDAVLRAPQPLDAWSRARWMPIAQNLGTVPFNQTVADNRLTPDVRVRAVEVLTEMFGGLPTTLARVGAQANSPAVRARIAWSLGRIPCDSFAPILLALSQDGDAMVRRCALEAIGDQLSGTDETALAQSLPANLGHSDKRVRHAAARVATLLSEPAWKTLDSVADRGGPRAVLTQTMAFQARKPPTGIPDEIIHKILAVLEKTTRNDLRLDGLRLIILALGDYHLNNPSLEVYTAYELPRSLKGHEELKHKILKTVRTILPSGEGRTDAETARLLAMLEDDDAQTLRKVMAFLTERSPPSADFHYLTALSRLKGTFPQEMTGKIAHAILLLDRKLQGQQERGKQNWTARLSEVVQVFLQRDPRLADAMLKHSDFARPAHVSLAGLMGRERQPAAARLMFDAANRDVHFTWSRPLIELLSTLPPGEVRPLFRRQWANLALHDDLLLQLANKPEPLDRDKFVSGLASLQMTVVRTSVVALLQLPPDRSGKDVPATVRLLRRSINESKEKTLRNQAVTLLKLQARQKFAIEESASDTASLLRAYQPVFAWFAKQFPALARTLTSDEEPDPAKWALLLKSASWARGDPGRGQVLFEQRGCQACHSGPTTIGPDLSGVTGRLSTNDLLSAILLPSRESAELYRPTVFQTRDAQTYNGIVVFESADGVMVQTGATATVRLADADIVSRRPSNQSLMPSGLLAGLAPQDLADLYTYLRTLKPRGQP